MTRFLLYSHDTYGLGHFRRCGLLASGLVGADPLNEVLIVTGSPMAQAFSLPERVDTVKLPTATKNDAGAYEPRKLGDGISRLIELRGKLIRSAVEAYRPDVILVDHSPLGMGGELEPTLRFLDGLVVGPRLVLGMRDIVDDATRVDDAWQRDGVWDQLDQYDEILVYGDPRVATTAHELGLAQRTRATVSHTGYVAPTMPEAVTDTPFLLVTPGGGGDGQAVLRSYLDAVEAGATSGMRSTIVTGPLLSAGRRAELLVRAESLPSVDVIEFSHRMRSLIASAAGVVSMAGYNTVVEELAVGVPSLLVPRRRPRIEQHIRATRLAAVTHLAHCPVDELSPDRIQDFITTCHPEPRPPSVDLSGVATAAATLTTSSRLNRSHAHA